MSTHYLTAMFTQTCANENIQWGFCHLIVCLHTPLLPINVGCCSEFPHVSLMLSINVSEFPVITKKDNISICVVSTDWDKTLLTEGGEGMIRQRVSHTQQQILWGKPARHFRVCFGFQCHCISDVCMLISTHIPISLFFTVTSTFLCSSVNL